MATALPTPDFSAILNKVFYKVAEDLTYGVVKDIETLILAGISIALILLGARLIFKYFDFRIDTSIASEDFKRASDYAGKRDSYSTGTAGYDYYNALYKQNLSKAVSYSKKYKDKSLTVDPEKPYSAPFVFTDGSSPEKPSFSAESDWDSASLLGGGYVGFAVSEDEDADRSDWTLMQEADITGLEVDSASSFSSERTDWTAINDISFDDSRVRITSSANFSEDPGPADTDHPGWI